MPTKFPLTWPDGWRRTPADCRRNLPADVPFGASLSRLMRELRLMGVECRDGRNPDVVISSDVPLRLDGLPRSDRGEPEDPGVAVYFEFDGRDLSFACDSYTMIRDNLRALALTIEALRGIERWGASDLMDRAFRGFAALPERATSPWRETLGFKPDERVTLEKIEQEYRRLVKTNHPDVGGNDETFRQIVEARTIARRETETGV
jgi:hypothetical protein